MIKVNIKLTCKFCGNEEIAKGLPSQIARFKTTDEHVQHIFPEWTPHQRELLISGMCIVCWDDTFVGTEDDQ